MVQLLIRSDFRGPAVDPQQSTEESDIGNECEDCYGNRPKPDDGLEPHLSGGGVGWTPIASNESFRVMMPARVLLRAEYRS